VINAVRPSLGHFPTLKQAIALRDISEDAPKRLGLFRRVYAGKSSPREAIKCKCLECVGFDVKCIINCTASECPLWAYRPYQAKGAS
jgi:hypothetical protein